MVCTTAFPTAEFPTAKAVRTRWHVNGSYALQFYNIKTSMTTTTLLSLPLVDGTCAQRALASPSSHTAEQCMLCMIQSTMTRDVANATDAANYAVVFACLLPSTLRSLAAEQCMLCMIQSAMTSNVANATDAANVAAVIACLLPSTWRSEAALGP